MKRLPMLFALLVCASAVAAQEHGKVVAIHTNSENRFIPGYKNSDGTGNNGVSVRDVAQVYRVETPAKFLELEGGYKLVLALGDVIDFRIDKRNAFVRIGKKDRKFRVVGEELKGKEQPTCDKCSPTNPLGI